MPTGSRLCHRGIDHIRPGLRVVFGGQWFYVAGILNPAVLAPNGAAAGLLPAIRSARLSPTQAVWSS